MNLGSVSDLQFNADFCAGNLLAGPSTRHGASMSQFVTRTMQGQHAVYVLALAGCTKIATQSTRRTSSL